jgi:hypothetical protein
MKALIILKESINRIPVLKYAFGIVGIAAAVAAIKGFGIENYTIPVIAILIIFGFMILLLIFSSILKSKDSKLKMAGYILTYTTLIITCISSFLLFTSAFFKVPIDFNPSPTIAKDTVDDKTITLTGKITTNGKILKVGIVGILQNSEIEDNLSVTGTFNLCFISPEHLNNGLITLTLTHGDDLIELMEINLNDFQSKDNILDLGNISLPSFQEISQEESPEKPKIETKVTKENSKVEVKVRKRPRKITQHKKQDQREKLPIRPKPRPFKDKAGGPGGKK